MNRRAFFCRAASLLPLPAFVRAASLWLPKERSPVADLEWEHVFWSKIPDHVWPETDGVLTFANTFILNEIPTVWAPVDGVAYLHGNQVWLHRKQLQAIQSHIEEHLKFVKGAESCRP